MFGIYFSIRKSHKKIEEKVGINNNDLIKLEAAGNFVHILMSAKDAEHCFRTCGNLSMARILDQFDEYGLQLIQEN